MSNVSRYLVIIALVLAGIVGVSAALDMVIAIPYGQNFLLDIMFLLGAGLIGYMGYETFQDYS